jgi:enoyl-CoA hydratase/carnithine racemase
MNVLSNEVARQLDAAVAETAEDDSIRAMVVYGGPRAGAIAAALGSPRHARLCGQS